MCKSFDKKKVMKSYWYKKPSDEMLYLLRNKYQYSKILIIDEIPMIETETFRHLNLTLESIIRNSPPFGEVSLLVTLNLLQARDHIGHSMDDCRKNPNT